MTCLFLYMIICSPSHVKCDTLCGETSIELRTMCHVRAPGAAVGHSHAFFADGLKGLQKYKSLNN